MALPSCVMICEFQALLLFNYYSTFIWDCTASFRFASGMAVSMITPDSFVRAVSIKCALG
jgi:hypothetical protein